MINRYIYLKAILATLVLFISFSSYAQNEDFMDKKKDGNEVFEAPSNKYSQTVQTAYTDLLSKLFNDRKNLNQEIAKLNSEKKELLKSGNKDINALNALSKSITEKSKELVSIEDDVELLRSGFSDRSTEKRALRIINSINSKRYGAARIETDTDKWVGNAKKNSNFAVERESSCKIEINGVDPVTLKSKVKLANENLIEYTHPKLESYYKDDAFLTADAGLMLLDKKYYLVLEMVIKSRDAIKNYGMIETGAPMKIQLLNGEAAYLFAVSNFTGVAVPNTNNVRYTTMFVVNKAEYKLLKKSEIDHIGIMWSSGYEKYDIYNIDLFMNQFECLDKFK